MPHPGVSAATFDYTASDGNQESAPATATLSIVPPPLAQLSPSPQAAGGMTIGFTGLSNASYSVWASTDFLRWTLVSRAAQPTPGVFTSTDYTATNYPFRFYRVTSP